MRRLKNLIPVGFAVLLLVALASWLTRDSINASAIRSTAPARLFYLTPNQVNGSQALTACTTGYHMASFYEIHETSNLTYNTTLGFAEDDDGLGPPTAEGWARTGSNTNVGTLGGQANCNVWTSNSITDNGSTFFLNDIPSVSNTGLWEPTVRACENNFRVWCVQN